MTSSRDIEVPEELLARMVPSGRRLGLVVGIDSYRDSKIPKLKAAVADACAMHAVMVDPDCGRFTPEHTVLLTDTGATERVIRSELERLENSATRDDEVWIFFAGHALVLGNEHRLLPVDCDRAYLKSSSIPFGASSRDIRCRRKVVFLDCCHAGATDVSTRAVHNVEDVFKSYNADGVITYCSSDDDQKSVELPELGRGAFSYWLERGMRGEADTDSNGVVTSDELWQFVRTHVEADALKRTGIRQTPRMKADTSGAFALSVNINAVRRKIEIDEAEAAHLLEIQKAEDDENKVLRQLLGVEDYELSSEEVKDAIRRKKARTSDAALDIRGAIETFKNDADAKRAVRSIRRILRDVGREAPVATPPPGFPSPDPPPGRRPGLEPIQPQPGDAGERRDTDVVDERDRKAAERDRAFKEKLARYRKVLGFGSEAVAGGSQAAPAAGESNEVRRFEYDVCISYANTDDQPTVKGQPGWVDAFHRALEMRLAHRLGRAPRIWFDQKVRDDDYPFNATLLEHLPSVALLVAVLSPSYLKSDRCRLELREFLRVTEGARTDDTIRVFVVVRTPVSREQMPPSLQGILVYEFFTVDSASGRTRELRSDQPLASPGDQRLYWLKLDDLAFDIAGRLAAVQPPGH